MNARDTYSRLRYELAPVGVTTMGPCANGCGEYARGSGVCRNCLVAELQVAVPTVDWPGFVVAMINSRNRIIDAELAIEGVERGQVLGVHQRRYSARLKGGGSESYG